MSDESAHSSSSAPRTRRALTAAERLLDTLEQSFDAVRATGSSESIETWSKGVRALTRRRAFAGGGPATLEVLRRAASLLKFQLARLPPAALRGTDGTAAILCTFARSLESLRDAGLTRRAHGFLAMLAGRLGVRGWSGRRDDSHLASFDTLFQKLIRRPSPTLLEAWLLLVQAAYASPQTMADEHGFYRPYAGKMLACVRVVPVAWLDPSKRFGSYATRLAEGLVRTRHAELTALGCEIAEALAERQQAG